VFWKAWFDVRLRFYLIFLLWIVLVGESRLDAALESVHARAVASQVAAPDAPPSEPGYGFEAVIRDWTTGQAHGTFSILAVLLAVGGLLGRPSGRADLLTLSLPPTRARWLWAQAGMALLLLGAIALLEAASILITGLVFDLQAPLGSVLAECVLVPLSAAIWIWPTILLMVLTRDSMRAAIIAITLMVGVASFGVLGAANRPFFRNIADVNQWSVGGPWAPLLAGLALAALTAWLALRRFDQMEF